VCVTLGVELEASLGFGIVILRLHTVETARSSPLVSARSSLGFPTPHLTATLMWLSGFSGSGSASTALLPLAPRLRPRCLPPCLKSRFHVTVDSVRSMSPSIHVLVR
jgi:hypothetical protein